MNILGVELEYDFFDADCIDKYEEENNRVKERIQEKTQYDGKSTGDSLRIQCGIVNDFFDSLFGDGTAETLFHGKSNIKDHMEAFAVVAETAMSSNKELEAISDKYSPNRVDRRAQQQVQKQNSKNFNRHNAAYNGNRGGKHN